MTTAERTPKVFLVNEPLRKDDTTGEYRQFLPMDSASKFGEVVELTPKGSPPANLSGYMKMIRDRLEDESTGWRDGDFLILVGDNALLAYAASVIGDIIGTDLANLVEPPPVLRLLKWERRQQSYAPMTLREPEAEPRDEP